MKAFNYIDGVVLVVSGVIAIILSALKTPLGFWLSAWSVQMAAFVFASTRKQGGHWPSTLFGGIAAAHIAATTVFLSRAGISAFGLLQLTFGLLFLHGLMYLLAAKPFMIRRGYLKSKPT